MQRTNRTRIAASAKINGDAGLILMGILLTAGSAAASVKITEDADGSGTAVLLVKALTNESIWVDLSNQGGIALSKGYATLAGAGAEATLFFE